MTSLSLMVNIKNLLRFNENLGEVSELLRKIR